MWWPEVSGGLNAKRGAALQVPRCTGTHTHSCWPRGTSDSSPAYSSYSSSTIFHSPCTSFLCQGLPGNRPNRPLVSFPKTSLSLSLSLGQYMESMGVEGFGAGILGATQCKGYFGCYTHTNSYLYPVTSHFLHVHLLSTIWSISHNLTHNFVQYTYTWFFTHGRLRSGNIIGTTREEGAGQESGEHWCVHQESLWNIGPITWDGNTFIPHGHRLLTRYTYRGVYALGVWRGPHDFINHHFGYSTLMSCRSVRS